MNSAMMNDPTPMADIHTAWTPSPMDPSQTQFDAKPTPAETVSGWFGSFGPSVVQFDAPQGLDLGDMRNR